MVFRSTVCKLWLAKLGLVLCVDLAIFDTVWAIYVATEGWLLHRVLDWQIHCRLELLTNGIVTALVTPSDVVGRGHLGLVGRHPATVHLVCGWFQAELVELAMHAAALILQPSR